MIHSWLTISYVDTQWGSTNVNVLVEPSRLHMWEDVTQEFLTQFASYVDIDVSK